MSEPIAELRDRLRKALSVRDLKPIELSQQTGIPKSAISQYMSGYAKPKQDRIYTISRVLDINEAWLMGYDVPMERKELSAEEGKKDAELIIKFSRLDETDKKIVTDLIDSLSKKKGD